MDKDRRLTFIKRSAEEELWGRPRQERSGTGLWGLFPNINVEAPKATSCT